MHRLIQKRLILTMLVIVFAKKFPENVIPIEYNLKIITNLGDEDDSFNFKGSVSIHIKCIYSNDSIVLHSKGLKVDEQKVVLRNLNRTEDGPSISGTSRDVESDFLILRLAEALEMGHHYEVELHFEGILEEEKVGYFRRSYLSGSGDKHWLGVTYFKPNNARRAFPCFDELTFKANFTISLGRSIRFRSLSNMPLLLTEKMEDKPGWVWDHFETTPRMSTYIVAFAVTNFENQTIQVGHNNRMIALSIWGTENITSYSDTALGICGIFLNTLRTNFGMIYPLPKLDLIVIPDYAAFVMEGWGLIVWQEYCFVETAMTLLYNPESMALVADQIVRQVFGNLVTIKSWTDLWFAEGLHMYLSNVLVNSSMTGDVELFRSDVTDYIISVFDFDSLEESLPLSTVGNKFENIETITEHHAHKKSFLFIRMLSHVLSYENLHKIIHEYLRIYAYKNAGSEELLELININFSFNNINIKTIFNTWITQAGFPLITVTRNYNHATLEVKQERFSRGGELNGIDTTKWWIPLTYTTECEFDFNRTLAKKWLSPNNNSISMEGPMSPGDWVIFNIVASGLYMVNYDEENWNLIINFLDTPFYQHIPQLNRVLLIDNAANLAWVGRLDYKIFFDLLKHLGSKREKNIDVPFLEIDIDPEYAALRALYDLSALLKRMPVHGRFMNYVREIFREMSDRAKSLNLDMYARKEYLQAKRHHQRSGILVIVSEAMLMLELILCTGDAAKVYPWSEYVENKDTENKKLIILRTLTCSNDQNLLQLYLKNSLYEESVGNEDIILVITAVVTNEYGFDLVRKFLNDNIHVILDRISPHFHKLSLPIIETARHVVSEDELTWLGNLLETNQEYFRAIASRMDEALEIAKLNVQWHNRNYRAIEIYFGEKYENFKHVHK